VAISPPPYYLFIAGGCKSADAVTALTVFANIYIPTINNWRSSKSIAVANRVQFLCHRCLAEEEESLDPTPYTAHSFSLIVGVGRVTDEIIWLLRS